MAEGWKRARLAISFLLRDLIKDGWRTSLTILNLVVFLCCYFCLAALAEASRLYGTKEENRDSLMVVSKNVFDPSDSVITAEDFLPMVELGGEDVVKVSPLIFQLLRVEKFFMQVRGALPEDFIPVYGLVCKEGVFPVKLDEAAIGEGTALVSGWKVGDTIRVFGRDFTITGVVAAPGTKASSIWITLDAAENLFGSQGVYQFAWITVSPGIDAEQVKERYLSDSRINDDFDVFYVDHLYDQYTRGLADVSTISSILVILALLLIMFGTYGSTFLILAERRREVTILRAVGFSAGKVQGILAWRTIVQLVTAYLVGWGISAFILKAISRVYPITVHAIPLDVVITPKVLGVGILLTLLFGLAGVWLSTIHLRRSSVQSTLSR